MIPSGLIYLLNTFCKMPDHSLLVFAFNKGQGNFRPISGEGQFSLNSKCYTRTFLSFPFTTVSLQSVTFIDQLNHVIITKV